MLKGGNLRLGTCSPNSPHSTSHEARDQEGTTVDINLRWQKEDRSLMEARKGHHLLTNFTQFCFSQSEDS